MKPPPIFSVIFDPSMKWWQRRLRWRRCQAMGLAKRSTIGCAGPRWGATEPTLKKRKNKQVTPMNIVQPKAPALSPELVAQFCDIVGGKYALTDAADIAPYLTEERNLYHGRSPLVLRPGSTAEV